MSRLTTKQRRARRVRNASRIIDAFLARNPTYLRRGLAYWPEPLWPALMTDGSWEGCKPGLSRYFDEGWRRIAGWPENVTTECTACLERSAQP